MEFASIQSRGEREFLPLVSKRRARQGSNEEANNRGRYGSIKGECLIECIFPFHLRTCIAVSHM